MLIAAIITITLALLFYSIGVWAEKLSNQLKLWHVAVFWIGLVCDTTGTTLMSVIAKKGAENIFHAITGIIAIALMLIHAVWATIVLATKKEKAQVEFHKFSIVVWFIWLIPYFSGVLVGIGH